jgi:hypothetical protein
MFPTLSCADESVLTLLLTLVKEANHEQGNKKGVEQQQEEPNKPKKKSTIFK